MKSRSVSRLTKLGAGAIVALASFSAHAQQFSGAIFTSLGDGTSVNANRYATKADVYLNGGPQNLNSNGLPDGTYFYQITDPSGATLLSTDPALCRQLLVVGGKVSGVAPVPPGCTPHLNGTQNPTTGSIPVQLLPFDDTPNGGGEYKVWLISQALGQKCVFGGNYVIAADGKSFVGIPGGCVKTDNFKVGAGSGGGGDTVGIGGVKYYDADTSSTFTPGDTLIPGFRIALTTSTGTETIQTDATGAWAKVLAIGSTFSVCEVLPDGIPPGATQPIKWIQTAPLLTDTLAGGAFVYNDPVTGGRCWSDTATADTIGLDFGNVCLGAGGGNTLGFWSNKNGQSRIAANSPNGLTFLALKPLVNGVGMDVTPFANYAGFRSWILGATATNMAYMLSAQYAAMLLNVNVGRTPSTKVSPDTLVYAGAATVPVACSAAPISAKVNAAGFIKIGDLLSAADAALSVTGGNVVVAPDVNGLRACQEYLKDALDNANNNANFVQPFASCPVIYAQPLTTP
jgi:hypothetical protein